MDYEADYAEPSLIVGDHRDVTTQVTPLSGAQADLESAVNLLDKKLSELVERLDPVLGPDNKLADTKDLDLAIELKNGGEISDAAARVIASQLQGGFLDEPRSRTVIHLNGLESRVRAITSRVNSALDRLEV